jgi:hypothetical protein
VPDPFLRKIALAADIKSAGFIIHSPMSWEISRISSTIAIATA